MTNQVLTPVTLGPNNVGVDLTGNLSSATQTTVQFANASNTFLVVASSTGTNTVTLNVGAMVLGQSVTAFTPVTLSSTGHLYAFGFFSSAVDQPGTNTVTVTLNSVTGITIGLFQFAGVY